MLLMPNAKYIWLMLLMPKFKIQINKTIIEFGSRRIWLGLGLCYLPQPSASADNTNLCLQLIIPHILLDLIQWLFIIFYIFLKRLRNFLKKMASKIVVRLRNSKFLNSMNFLCVSPPSNIQYGDQINQNKRNESLESSPLTFSSCKF